MTGGKLFEMCYEKGAFHQGVTRSSKSHIRNMLRIILIDGEEQYRPTVEKEGK